MVGIYRCNSRVVSQEFLCYSNLPVNLPVKPTCKTTNKWLTATQKKNTVCKGHVIFKMIPLYGLNEMGETYSTEPKPVSNFDPIS